MLKRWRCSTYGYYRYHTSSHEYTLNYNMQGSVTGITENTERERTQYPFLKNPYSRWEGHVEKMAIKKTRQMSN